MHRMNIFRRLKEFIEDDPNSMRLGATRKRLRKYDISYCTIADGKRAMQKDMQNFYGDFYKAVKSASIYGKESRTE